MDNKNKWLPLLRAEPVFTENNAKFKNTINCDIIFKNNLYQVNYRFINEFPVKLIHLSIKRLDKEAIHDWRHLQLIKNELCGAESCAIEVYPPESILVDTANQYHLWVFDSAEYFPFIFQKRLVAEEPLIDGAKQRPFEDFLRPDDLLTAKTFIEMLINKD